MTLAPIFNRDHGRDGAKAITLTAKQKCQNSVSRLRAHAGVRLAIPALVFSGLIASTLPGQASEFKFDQRRTEVSFVYTMGLSTMRGRFSKVSGSLNYDETAPENSRISAEIDATTLATGDPLVDSELKGTQFFNVATSPVIAFKSSAVRSLSPTAADVLGEITVNGITKAVTLKVSLDPHDDPALKHDAGARKFIARTRIQRSEFNMTGYPWLVADDVDIEIDAVVRPNKGTGG